MVVRWLCVQIPLEMGTMFFNDLSLQNDYKGHQYVIFLGSNDHLRDIDHITHQVPDLGMGFI